jgi:hypothetical protein
MVLKRKEGRKEVYEGRKKGGDVKEGRKCRKEEGKTERKKEGRKEGR